ncbi:type II toxin-antitoxin system PrlF family antitoxin [Neokomagataea anthophila]|uniref:Type II toxin-antitoxin system PrlF family antitoxin n=1 Tax=Neokomagataea anthophila TaxID=2826925 RepID=A0ABS5E9D1_9PROT|nr:type II toxin-antitoxin system PrlF family antitoxin [Neokomagataea anthophila]MBR0560514.1 type II toxin-antitoxin system PrlF family antitoxin [Neokomagataea anthophila]
MTTLLKDESTLTSKGQATIPKAVRQALGVDYGGRIAFIVDDNRRVTIEKVAEEAHDPVIESFLSFLTRDMTNNPDTSLLPMPGALRERMGALVSAVDDDLEGAIDGPVAL